MTLTPRQTNFIDKCKNIVTSAQPNDPKRKIGLQILLVTGVIDGDMPRVVFAVENGADVNASLHRSRMHRLNRMGWAVRPLAITPSCGRGYGLECK